MSFLRLTARLAVLFVTASLSYAAYRERPAWIDAVANLPAPANAAGAPALVLLDQTALEVDSKGVAVEIHRYAVRILHLSARRRASAVAYYNGTSDRILDADAWLLRKGEEVHVSKASEWSDAAANSAGAAIDESRVRQIDFTSEALVDDVFAFETRTRRSLLVAQLRWLFGSVLPTLKEELTVQLPAGFELEESLFGAHQPARSKPAATTWSWTAFDRPYRAPEGNSAPNSHQDAELVVRILAPSGSTSFVPQSFSSWPEVTALYDSLNRGQCDSSPELVAKVHELVGTAEDELTKIQALGQYVQKLRYIAINQGLRYGFGWKARQASQVFATGYGDCKDKANLLNAMLREAGLRSYRVIALVDPDFGMLAHSECPTPAQFNHAIVAIAVQDSLKAPAIIETPQAGRLLFFDPTDPYTAVGDLPYELQGTFVHLATPESRELIQLPRIDAKAGFAITRHAKLAVAADGSGSMTGQITGFGQQGAAIREASSNATLAKEKAQIVLGQLSESFRAASLQESNVGQIAPDGSTRVTFTCLNPRFAQRVQGSGTILKMDVFSRRYLPELTEPQRSLPIEVRPAFVQDQVEFSLPDGYVVDELPSAFSLETPYGTYESSFAFQDKLLLMKRTLCIRGSTIPVVEYAALRRFLADIARADRASVLIKRSP